MCSSDLVKELAAWLKANPKQASYGTPGAGALTHFLSIEFGRMIGVDMEHVPYRGSPPVVNDLIAGQIPIAALGTSEFTQHHEGGTLRVIGTFTEGPSPFIKGVATMKSQGIDLVARSWYAFYGPVRMPRDLQMQLNKIINDMVREPAVRQRFLAMGVEAAGTTPEELTAIQKFDKDYWGPIVKRSGWKPDL